MARQTTEFLLAAAVGGGLGFLYDVCRLVRGRMRLKAVTNLMEGLFLVVAALAVIGFTMVVLGGEARIFAFMGGILGGIMYFLTLSRIVLRVGFAVIDAILRVLLVIFSPFIAAGRHIAVIYAEKREKRKKCFPKSQKRCIIRKILKGNGDKRRYHGENKESEVRAEAGSDSSSSVCGDKYPEAANRDRSSAGGHSSPGAGNKPATGRERTARGKDPERDERGRNKRRRPFRAGHGRTW